MFVENLIFKIRKGNIMKKIIGLVVVSFIFILGCVIIFIEEIYKINVIIISGEMIIVIVDGMF